MRDTIATLTGLIVVFGPVAILVQLFFVLIHYL